MPGCLELASQGNLAMPPGEVVASQNIALNFSNIKYADFISNNTFVSSVVNNLYIYIHLCVEEIYILYT